MPARRIAQRRRTELIFLGPMPQAGLTAVSEIRPLRTAPLYRKRPAPRLLPRQQENHAGNALLSTCVNTIRCGIRRYARVIAISGPATGAAAPIFRDGYRV